MHVRSDKHLTSLPHFPLQRKGRTETSLNGWKFFSQHQQLRDRDRAQGCYSNELPKQILNHAESFQVSSK